MGDRVEFLSRLYCLYALFWFRWALLRHRFKLSSAEGFEGNKALSTDLWYQNLFLAFLSQNLVHSSHVVNCSFLASNPRSSQRVSRRSSGQFFCGHQTILLLENKIIIVVRAFASCIRHWMIVRKSKRRMHDYDSPNGSDILRACYNVVCRIFSTYLFLFHQNFRHGSQKQTYHHIFHSLIKETRLRS